MADFQVNERLYVDGELCTVKFIGEIPNWPGQVALGVEWDDQTRGKHSGEINGVQYFETTQQDAGSFIKGNSKKIRKNTDFMTAMIATYGTPFIQTKEIKFGSKVVQSYGFQQLEAMQSDFNSLQVVSLNRKRVGSSVGGNSALIDSSFQSVKNLDLSFNLFTNLTQIWEITDKLPNLATLVLNGNRFPISNVSEWTNFPHLKNLSLTTTLITSSELVHVLDKFPNLEELMIAANTYGDSFQCDKINDLQELVKLDLSYNNFRRTPKSFITSNIKNLNIANNDITFQENSKFEWPDLEEIDLRGNSITKWEEIDEIKRIFPKLTHLRINKNPLFNDISSEEMQINIIARIGDGLEKLNGSLLSQEEITNSELFFISKVEQEELVFDKNSSRWKELVKKYDIKTKTNNGKKDVTGFNSKLIRLSIQYGNNKSITKICFLHDSVLKLRGSVSKLISKSPIDIELSYNFETDDNRSIRNVLKDDLASLSAYDFEDNQIINVNYINSK